MDNKIKERLLDVSTTLYKEGGYNKVVARAKIIYGEDKHGLVSYLSDFNKYMEVKYGKG